MDSGRSFGAWVRARRKALGLTLKELAYCAGYRRVMIEKIESGHRLPSEDKAQQLARCLQLQPEEVEAFVRWARYGTAADLAPVNTTTRE